MNQILANKLNEEGAIILILNMQVGAEVGLDYNSWLAGKEFMGFKMVSPGFHCLFYSAVSQQQEFSTRTIIPLFLRAKEVRIFQWSAEEEQLIDQSHLPRELVEKYQREGAEFVFDSKTAAYPFETIGKWMNMTNGVTPELFSQLMDKQHISFILDPTSTPNYNYSETINISQLIQQSNARTQMVGNVASSPVSKLSQLYIDSSDELEKLCQSYPGKRGYANILGEFQFAFVLFHIGQDYESLLQWKNILFLVTASFTLATSKDILALCSFYQTIMKTLYLQLSELEDDFFLLSEGGNDDVHEGSQTTRPTSANRKNFVIKCLESFNSIMEEEPDGVDEQVLTSFESIKQLMRKRFHVELQSDNDGPVIVESS